MEEDQKTQGVTQEQVPQEAPQENKPDQSVNFSSLPTRSAKPKSGAKTFLGIFILIIFVVGGFLIFKDSNKNKVAEETPAPAIEQASSTPTPEATPVPVDKSKVAIEIQNGTGIPGEAAYLQDALKALGYSDFKLGNAVTSDNVTTIVTYRSTVDQSVQDEISQKLNSLYKEVTVKSSTTQVSEVVVITGLQKGATAKPAVTATATPSASASPSGSPSSTPTATP